MNLPSGACVPAQTSHHLGAKVRNAGSLLGPLSRFLLLVVFPAVYLVTTSNFVRARGPFWQGQLYDPNYQYLLNSLLLLEGQTPGHVDHPGTPVQIIGAGLLATKNVLFDQRKNLARAVIKNPEKYLKFLSTSLRWLFAITLLLAPLWIWLRTNSFSTAIAFQIAPLLNWMTFVEGGIYFKPESLITTLILWFCAWVATDLIRQSQQGGAGWTLERTLAALAAGACVATKIHTAPLFAIALSVTPSPRKALVFWTIATVSFLICIIPILPVFHQTINFAFQMASHTQRYGEGEVGFIDPRLFWDSLRSLILRNWMTFSLVGLFAGYHALRVTRRSEGTDIRLHLIGLFIAGIQGLFLLMVAKHPANHYLLPLVVSMSLNMALIVYTLLGTKMCRLGISVLSLLSLIAMGLALFKVAYRIPRVKAAAKANVAFYETISQKYDFSLRADFYSCSSPAFALLYGDGYCHGYFSGLIQQRWPNIFYFSIFNSNFVTKDDRLSPEAMLRIQPVLYLYGVEKKLVPLKGDFPEGTRFTVLEKVNGLTLTEVRSGPATDSDLLPPP